jgi:hypothetical protein
MRKPVVVTCKHDRDPSNNWRCRICGDEPDRAERLRPIGAETCNALITEAPLTNSELDGLRVHFAGLVAALEISGPRFSNARRDAVDMHNRVVRRLRGIRDEVRRRATLEEDESLMEI